MPITVHSLWQLSSFLCKLERQRKLHVKIFYFFFNLLWGDLFTIPLPGGNSMGVSLLVLILIPLGIFYTIYLRGVQFRHFPLMIKLTLEKKGADYGALSGLQALLVSTATRVGMGNLVGVVAAVSVGGAGAIFWMWFAALLGGATAFVEGTLAQKYKTEDKLYGGFKGGPAYYLDHLYRGKKRKSILAVLFALSGLLCWCGISQVIGNSVTSALDNAFHIDPLVSTIVLVAISAVIVLRKNSTVKVVDIIVPVMAILYFCVTIFIIAKNITLLPGVFKRIFQEAFGIKAVAGGGIGAVLMNGVKRGLFSNEAGSGSAPCAAATASVKSPVNAGLLQSLGVFIDTIVICSCTAFIMLLSPESVTAGKVGMDLLQSAMYYHMGTLGVILIAITLFLFSFSTFIGVLFYARSNVSYVFGENWLSQTLYKILALVMLFIGGLAEYTFVWDLGDFGIALMTVFNMFALIPLSKTVKDMLREYDRDLSLKASGK